MSAVPTINARPSAADAGERRAFALLFAAWLVALGATLGALLIGEVLGQTPCTLCWYQRIAMFPLALLLGLACLHDDASVRRYALPLAAAGGVVAAWHTLVYYGVAPTAIVPCAADGPSCSGSAMTILGGVPLPLLSLGSFALVIALLLPLPRRPRR